MNIKFLICANLLEFSVLWHKNRENVKVSADLITSAHWLYDLLMALNQKEDSYCHHVACFTVCLKFHFAFARLWGNTSSSLNSLQLNRSSKTTRISFANEEEETVWKFRAALTTCVLVHLQLVQVMLKFKATVRLHSDESVITHTQTPPPWKFTPLKYKVPLQSRLLIYISSRSFSPSHSLEETV